MADYSILTYNIGGYEVLHEVECKSERAEYIYVTDDRSITSSTWTVVYVDNPHPNDPFWLCYQIRFNPFKYVNTDIVLRIDGSMRIVGDTDRLIDAFNKGGYDIALTPHPTRQTMLEEYTAWVRTRGYDANQANRILSFFNALGWHPQNDKGLYQYNFMIQRNNAINNELNDKTLYFLRLLKKEGDEIERVDQTVGSFVVNTLEMKPMMLKQRDIFPPFVWCAHGSSNPLTFCGNTTLAYYKKKDTEWYSVS